MNNLPIEVQRLIYSFDNTYNDKYNKVLKHLKYLSQYLMRELNNKIESNNRYYGYIRYIKKESKKLYPPVGFKFWGGLSDSDSDSD